MAQNSQEPIWTIPNILSLYRLLVFPLILYFIVSQQEQLFVVFIAISLITDILDGAIARGFNMQTKLGAKLDSWADLGVFVLAFFAAYQFRLADIKGLYWLFILYLFCWFLAYLVVFIKFKGLIGLHTYMFKVTGYLQGIFMFVWFVFGFQAWLCYLALGWGTLACIEEIIIILIIPEPRSNVKGLYWVLKN
ncbi:CDP-alcohol phosphatidyltransferase family protein [uncultured Microscilla sp.]|uniref:CDP-alcohol phosphatidyltransferase family protein n=1 Tax=uncultured Microscilla sp. TaxID=432653 RepID=UPI002633DB2A|nr:CDP-alcohol phosphatidyltransferase family protein [uncultured Microscilla sp.]